MSGAEGGTTRDKQGNVHTKKKKTHPSGVRTTHLESAGQYRAVSLFL